jgi:hypothetical protein
MTHVIYRIHFIRFGHRTSGTREASSDINASLKTSKIQSKCVIESVDPSTLSREREILRTHIVKQRRKKGLAVPQKEVKLSSGHWCTPKETRTSPGKDIDGTMMRWWRQRGPRVYPEYIPFLLLIIKIDLNMNSRGVQNVSNIELPSFI